MSCRSKLYPVKAMVDADTFSVPMADSQASGSGSTSFSHCINTVGALFFLSL